MKQERRKRELPNNSPSRVFGRKVEMAMSRKWPVWTQGDLAEALQKVGSDLDRDAVQKIVSGRRKGITLEEVFEIAAALDVNPVELVTPYREGETVAVTPTRDVDGQLVREWFGLGPYATGRPLSLGTADPTLYREFISEPEQKAREAIYNPSPEGMPLADEEGNPLLDEDGNVRRTIPVKTDPPKRRRTKVVPKKRPKPKGEQ